MNISAMLYANWGGTGIGLALSTNNKQGRQYLEPNVTLTGVTVKASTVIGVGDRVGMVNTDVDVSTLDTGVLTIGTDYYVYAVHTATSIGFILSANSTYPTGYDANNSRKIGGFHYGRIRTIAQRFSQSAVLDVKVVPNSVWDLFHRPKCSPEGFAEIFPGGPWGMIYLASEDGTAWPNTVPVSRYNATPLTGTEGYSYFDHHRLAANAGCRIPSYAEWLAMAYGTPEGSAGGSARIKTGGVGWSPSGGNPAGTTYWMVSCNNFDQRVGNVYQPCADFFDFYNGNTGVNGAYSWVSVDQGKDSPSGQGAINSQGFKQLIAGCDWGNGANAGARGARLDRAPSDVLANVGLCCVSDPL